MIPRERYLEELRRLKGAPFVKAITGIRRCGKSVLMKMFIEELKASGVPDEMIFYANLEDESLGIGSFRDLIGLVDSKVGGRKGPHLFLDEIQSIPEWERAVSALHSRGADVCIAGSGSDMLSGELSAKLSGRCIEIRMQPLMFSEYVRFRKGGDADALLDDYLRTGGFPGAVNLMDASPNGIRDSLDGIFSTIVLKDVICRHRIRDGAAVDRVAKHLMKNIGGRTSVRSMAECMAGAGVKAYPRILDQYISYLEEALVFTRCRRMDPETKEYLRTSDKFYIADMGLRSIKIPFSSNDLDGAVENAVFNELRCRYGSVAVYGAGAREVDFVADPAGSPSYYQACISILDRGAREREVRPLKLIDDNYPKTIVTYDRPPFGDIDGIRVVSLRDWLLESAEPGAVAGRGSTP